MFSAACHSGRSSTWLLLAVGPGGTCGGAGVQVTTPGFPPELAVRILVAFDRQESAIKVFSSLFPLHPRPLARTCSRTPACTHARNTRQLALPFPTVAAARFQLGQPDTCSDSSFVRLEAPWQGSSQTARFLRQQPRCAAAAAECTRLWRVDRGRLLLCRRQWTSEVSWVCQAGREPRTIHELGFSGRWPWCPR